MPWALWRSSEVGGLGQLEGRSDCLAERRGLYLVGLRVACFSAKAAKVFPGLDFNFQVPVEGEAEESDSKDKADPVVFSDAPSSVPFPSEPEIEASADADSPTSVAGTSPSDLHGLEVWVIKVA